MPIPSNFPKNGGIPSRIPQSLPTNHKDEEIDFLKELEQDDDTTLPDISEDDVTFENSNDEMINEENNDVYVDDDSLTFTPISTENDNDEEEKLSDSNSYSSPPYEAQPKKIVRKKPEIDKQEYKESSLRKGSTSVSVKELSENIENSEKDSMSSIKKKSNANVTSKRGKLFNKRSRNYSPAGADDRTWKKEPRPTRATKDYDGKEQFVDNKSKKLLPFGGSKKPSVKDSDIDPRADRRRKANIVQWSVIGLLGVGAIGGWYQVIAPPDTMGEEEIAEIAQTAIGATDFPMQTGEAFAKEFMQAYLTTSNSTADSVLGYFYSGELGGNVEATNRVVSRGYTQSILYGPTVHSSTPLTDYSANYVVGALVESSVAEDPSQVVVTEDGAPSTEGEVTPESIEGNTAVPTGPRWMFFSVNVFYNANADRFYVTPDSPGVVPQVEVGRSRDVPTASLPGTGQADDVLGKDIQSVVYGFMEGYAKSSSSEYGALEQYVAGDDSTILNGLNNEYIFASGSVENSVDYSAFPVEGNSNEIKALVNVSWATPIGDPTSNVRTTYESQYVMTLTKDGSKWLVSKFQPYLYVADDQSDVQEMDK